MSDLTPHDDHGSAPARLGHSPVADSPHTLRVADTDPKAAKRAERQVAVLFTLSILGTLRREGPLRAAELAELATMTPDDEVDPTQAQVEDFESLEVEFSDRFELDLEVLGMDASELVERAVRSVQGRPFMDGGGALVAPDGGEPDSDDGTGFRGFIGL